MNCQSTTILWVYHQPGVIDLKVAGSLYHFIPNHNLIIILLGNLNVQHPEWFGSSCYSVAGRSLWEFCEFKGKVQLFSTFICSSSILDLIITPYCGTVCCHPRISITDQLSFSFLFIIIKGHCISTFKEGFSLKICRLAAYWWTY